jgi:signal transduction histidine kinase
MGRLQNTSRKTSPLKVSADDQLRQRIAGELRNSTLQAAAALAINLGVVKRLAGPWSDAAKVAIDECLQLAEQCQREIRTFSYLLHPPLHEQFGIHSVLSAYLAAFERRNGCRVILLMDAHFSKPLLPSFELIVFRVVQECFAGIEQIAPSLRQIEVRCRRTPVQLSIHITTRMRSPLPRFIGRLTYSLDISLSDIRRHVKHLGGELTVRNSKTTVASKLTLPVARTSQE